MRVFIVLLLLIFVVTLVGVVGVRVASRAETFRLGLICGVAASVPASILARFLMRRQSHIAYAPPAPAYPPVYIVNGAPVPPPRPAPDYPPLTNPQTAQAAQPRYRVIGEEGE